MSMSLRQKLGNNALFPLLGALGLRLAIVPDPSALAPHRMEKRLRPQNRPRQDSLLVCGNVGYGQDNIGAPDMGSLVIEGSDD